MNAQHTDQCRLNEQEDHWELILTRTLNHPRETVWEALTRADELVKWGPFKPDRDLTEPGAVRLTHMNNPREDVRQGFVLTADPPELLLFQWGDDILRWELHEVGDSTKLTLRHQFANRPMAPSYAAGWHLCLKGLEGTLAGIAMPSMVGSKAADYGYNELYQEYEAAFGKNP